jgi:alginate O-acetyltransferase complex protein AlgJ
MEHVAGQLAAYVKQHTPLTAVTAPSWTVAELPIARVGDIVRHAEAARGPDIFSAPQAVTVHQVRDADGQPWAPDEKGRCVAAGDSFTNVFSLAPMGWGEGAGLAPHLARALGRPSGRHRPERLGRLRHPQAAQRGAGPRVKIAWPGSSW